MSDQRTTLLRIDALVNLALGVLLLAYPAKLVEALGIPWSEPPFYARVLGGVLFGIGLALWLEVRGGVRGARGLGLQGAVAINTCGALALAGSLAFGDLQLPTRGLVFLWGLVALLIGLSAWEGWSSGRGASSG